MRTAYIFVPFFFFSTFLWAQKTEPYDIAQRLAAGHEYASAIAVLNKMLLSDPKAYKAYGLRGDCYLNINNLDAAERDYLVFVKAFPNDSKGLAELGLVYNLKHKNKKALHYFNKALLIDPTNAVAHLNRGVTFQDLGDIRSALAEYSAAMKYDSTIALAYNNHGAAIFRNQDIADPSKVDLELAIKEFTRAIELDSGLCDSRGNRAFCYKLLGNNEAALADYNDAIKCNANVPRYYLNRAEVEEKLEKYEEAEKDYDQVATIIPSSAELWLGLGQLHIKTQNYEKAMEDYKTLLQNDSRYKPVVYFNMARLYSLSGSKEFMLKYLVMAKKAGYFKDKSNVGLLQKDKDFDKFRKENDFKAFLNKL